MSKRPLTEAEVRSLIGDREHTPFLNSRNELYRERGMKANPPDREEAIRLMAQNPNLIRRPLIVDGDTYLFGFDEEAYRALTSE